MADVRPRRGCDDTCGCPNPCPGGEVCRCARIGDGGGSVGAGLGAQHALCSCGEHCSCNPCSCGRTTAVAGTGMGACSCGSGCTCSTCSS